MLRWVGVRPYLHRVHGTGGEGGVGQRLGGPQEVADAVEVMLVLFDGLDAQSVSGQHRLVARGVARGREELEVAVATSQQEANPGG